MAQELPEQTLESHADPRIAASSSSSSDAANASPDRLNAGALEFVPEASPPPPPQQQHPGHRTGRMVHHGTHPHQRAFQHHPPGQQFGRSPPQGRDSCEYFEGGGGGGVGEHEAGMAPEGSDHSLQEREGVLSDEVVQRIRKQVEYYFSDINLATTEQLMRFISKDPDGYVPLSVIASFKKIKALVHDTSSLADALRTSSKLVVSEDGKKVGRTWPFTVFDLEELQTRIVVAENLPEDHSYQSLMKIFSVTGRVKNIRTCYPQTPNVAGQATNRSTKMDMLFSNKVHAFVEYENIEDAERAVVELNDGTNWRSGLRVRVLHRCMMQHVQNRGRKTAHEGDENTEECDVSTTNLPNDKQLEDPSQLTEALEHTADDTFYDKENGARRGRGRGRGGRGCGRGQYHSNNHHSGGHMVGTPPSGHQIHTEHLAVTKQPPGPRMPDGTKGFTMGRGKPLALHGTC